MLKSIVDFSLRFRGIVIAMGCAISAYGLYVTAHAKLDVFPEFTPPQVDIQTEAPGLSPEQVEALVTRPVESAVNGVGNLESVRSQSIQGLSIITVTFREGTNAFMARQMLGERLAEMAGELPTGVSAPRMTPLTSATMDLLKVGLASEKLTPMELRTFADWTIRPLLLAAEGVASAHVYGGEVRQLQVQVRPDRLAAFELSIQDVLEGARNCTAVRGAGFVETAAQRIVLQTLGQPVTAAQLGEVVLKRQDGVSVRLKDVANVVDGAEPKVGDARIQGKPGVLIALLSQFGANTLETTRRLEGVLADLKPSLEAQGIQLFPPLFRPASFIETAVHNIGHSLLLGAVFVVAVLFLFMFNLRAAFISITAIPLSLLVAIIVLDRWGLTLNTITLGGLAIALGVVVDDAVIDVENIYRRLRENAASPEPRSNFRVVLDASLEVRSAVVYATFVVALVFLPVLSMSGLQGRLFAPLGLAYILAVMTSLGVALTITPALCMVLLPRRARTAREPRPIRGMKAGYRRLLLPLMRYPGAVIGPVLLFCAIAALLLHRFGAEFLPEFREGHFVLHINTIPGSSLQESGRVGSLIAAELLKDKRIQTVPQQIGRAELGEDAWGPHRSESHTQLAPNTTAKEQDQVEDFIRQTLKSFPGITFDVTTFLGDRIGETISGETAQVVVSVFGEDLDALDQKAREVADVLAGIRGNADVLVASPPGAPQLAIQLRPERLLQFGFQPTQVLDAMQTAYQGTRVAQTYEGSRVFDVAVILDEQYRRDPEDVRGLLLRSPDGVLVPLSELADVYLTTGRYTVLHDGARRRQTVTCNVRGRDVASFVAEAKQKVAAQVRFPGGVYPIFTGAAEARAQARNELFVHSSIAGLGIVLLLAMVFGSLRNLLLVLVNLPLAFVGGVVAAYFSGGNLSLGSLVGFVTLFGITTRNSIMMISHYDHLVREEGMLWGLDAALRGASERIVPILMTALVTALGLLPIALGSGEAGREIEGPMAIVILGGLATSTLLNLLILPTLALRFGRFGRRTEMAD